jgi:hypothetical protein
MKTEFEVTSGSHYPITTEGRVDKSTWESCAREAMKMHRENLRDMGKIRKHGDKVTLKIWKI